jgi:hypothetical protein
VKLPAAEAHGYDACNTIKAYKPSIFVDAHGQPLMVDLTAASNSESAGSKRILDARRLQASHKSGDGGEQRR